MQIYNTSALYNQNMNEEKQKMFMQFYSKLFSNLNIKTVHDCSIGAGGTTLPLAKLGFQVSGSDLSENLLKKADENFNNAGFKIDLCKSDFRDLSNLPNTYDCMISTGNSLPHINNADVITFIKECSQKLNDNGYLYIDIRNWDAILKERPIFKARDPRVMTSKEHSSLYHFWNWYKDNSVDFVFVTSTDKNGKHEKHSVLKAPTYYPLKLNDYKKMLTDNGFVLIDCYDLDHLWIGSEHEQHKVAEFNKDFEFINWYGILAQKL